MLQMTLLTLSLLGFTAANTLNTVRIPAYRRTLSVNTSATLLHPINYNDRWATFGFYFIEMGIGTPPQPVQLALDTGSSDMWVPFTNAPACLNLSDCPAGTFDPARSSTFQLDKRERCDLRYADLSTTYGNYSFDTVTLKGAILSNFSFTTADIMTHSRLVGDHFGMLGLSTQGLEDDYQDACRAGDCSKGVRTPTITDALVSAGHIETPCYSLFLDDRRSQKGSILFGGIDTAKFTGPLVTLHTTPEDNVTHPIPYARQQLRLTNLTMLSSGYYRRNYGPVLAADPVNTNDTTSPGVTVQIDTGHNAIMVPQMWAENVMHDLPIHWDLTRKYGTHIVLCEDADTDRTLTFTLEDEAGDSAQIDVPFHELLVPIRKRSSSSMEPILEDGKQLCYLALSGSQGDGSSLGDPFLRSAYTFYNLEQHTISLAQAANNSTGENIVPIGKGPMRKLSGTG